MLSAYPFAHGYAFLSEREGGGEAKISTLRSPNNHAKPTGFESHHSCVPGWKMGKELLPKSSYCLTAMNLGVGGVTVTDD